MNIYLSNLFLTCISCKPEIFLLINEITLNTNLLQSKNVMNLKKVQKISQKTSNKIITTYYPKKLLKVKEDLLISNQFDNKIVFDEKTIILLSLLFLFLFTMYEVTENKHILKQKFKSNFRLKQSFGNFTKLQMLEKILQKLKDFFVLNNFIYLDQINKNREENTVCFYCKHYFLDVKKEQKVILTKDFPDFLLFAGMTGVVKKVLLNQKLEIVFFYNSQDCDSFTKQKLYNFQTSVIKEADFFIKNK